MKSLRTLLLLFAPVAAALAVPVYNRVAPTLDGWPFFYWWQTACVLAGALLTAVAHVLDVQASLDPVGEHPTHEKGHTA
ncbi:DUF3311 domain-containing protein [Paraburkholderia sp. BR13439]|uniref:DUF3311 domain-containing protein n=1 Tax=Paraburkholderia TaxID=1822464 RepID=UPI0034CD360A